MHESEATTYLRLTAAAEFTYELDYGSHPDSVYNGTFDWVLVYTVNVIVVHDGRTVLVPSRSMLVDGAAYVEENRTLWSRTGRVRVRCKDDFKGTRSDDRVAVFSAGNVSVSGRGLSVDPGPAVAWNTCSATESLPSHGLLGGPAFTVPAPAKSRFSGSRAFSMGCKDSYKHPYDRPGQSNGHSFSGSTQVWVRLTPFPESKLAQTKTALRDKAGKALTGGYETLDSRSLKDCA